MYNFNHERFYVSVCALRLSRVCVQESIKWALKREAFGAPLARLQSIRMKLAVMGRQCELLQAWLEQLAYQMSTMEHAEAQIKISDIMCNCKVGFGFFFCSFVCCCIKL
jgi:alkylation response protein AidB-like acyl-CoA dehydrogenase